MLSNARSAAGGRPFQVAQLERPKTLTGVVIDHIRDQVLRGELGPGTPLPEVPLAASLKTSRGTVREALRALGDVGLVEVHPHRGAFVTELSAQRTNDLFDLRALLEAHAVKCAITEGLIDDDAMRRIDDAFRRLRESVAESDMFAIVDADIDLHSVIASASKRDLLLEHLNAIQMQTRRAIMCTKVLDTDIESEVESHAPIVEAIADRDAERAVDALREHILRSGRRLVERLVAEGRP